METVGAASEAVVAGMTPAVCGRDYSAIVYNRVVLSGIFCPAMQHLEAKGGVKNVENNGTCWG